MAARSPANRDQNEGQAPASLDALLGHNDVAKLLTDPATATRAELADKIGHVLGQSELSGAEQRLALDIAWTLARDVAEAVRAALAETVRASDALPRELALALAEDVDRVALPVLACATSFTEADLRQFAGQPVASRQTAIAQRSGLPRAVAAHLLAHAADESVAAALLRNSSADLDSELLGEAVSRFGEADSVCGAAALHPALTRELAERLMAAAAGQLLDGLLQRSGMDPDIVAELVIEARERASARLLGERHDPFGLDNLVDMLAERARLTPGLILRLAACGDLAFVERALARSARIPLANARALMYNAGTLGLKSLAEKAGIPADQFAVLHLAVTLTQSFLAEQAPASPAETRSAVAARLLTKTRELDASDRNFLLRQIHAPGVAA